MHLRAHKWVPCQSAALVRGSGVISESDCASPEYHWILSPVRTAPAKGGAACRPHLSVRGSHMLYHAMGRTCSLKQDGTLGSQVMHQAIPGNCKYVPSLICGLCVRLSGTLGIEEDEQTRPCFCSHLFQSLQCVPASLLPLPMHHICLYPQAAISGTDLRRHGGCQKAVCGAGDSGKGMLVQGECCERPQ